VQRYADAALRSGFRTSLLERLANLGSCGRHPKNIHSQMLTTFCPRDLANMVRPITAGCVTHIIYPHEVFNFIARDHPAAFKAHLGADVDKLLQFWTAFLETPYGRHRFADRTPSSLTHCIPMILHGDAVPVTRKQSALFAQWGSLIGRHFLGGGPPGAAPVASCTRVVGNVPYDSTWCFGAGRPQRVGWWWSRALRRGLSLREI
jgi:hypothetical protein